MKTLHKEKKIALSAIFFDLDGTLINSMDDIVYFANKTLENNNIEKKDKNTIAPFVGHGARYLMSKLLNISLIDPKVDLLAKEFAEIYAEMPVIYSSIYSGVEDILQYFKNIPMWIVSNKPEPAAKSLAKKFNIANCFQDIVGGERHAEKKPNPIQIETIINNFNIDRKTALMVGDSHADILAGKNAGIMTCAVNYGFSNKETLAKYKPDFQIDNINELLNIFSN